MSTQAEREKWAALEEMDLPCAFQCQEAGGTLVCRVPCSCVCHDPFAEDARAAVPALLADVTTLREALETVRRGRCPECKHAEHTWADRRTGMAGWPYTCRNERGDGMRCNCNWTPFAALEATK